MIEQTVWEAFRHKLRSIRTTGKLVKYIGKPSKTPVFISGIPMKGERIYLGNDKDFSVGPKDFVNATHLNSSFSIDGVLIEKY